MYWVNPKLSGDPMENYNPSLNPVNRRSKSLSNELGVADDKVLELWGILVAKSRMGLST
jgi:hypothetical protein